LMKETGSSVPLFRICLSLSIRPRFRKTGRMDNEKEMYETRWTDAPL
jgi:hypothetical protein